LTALIPVFTLVGMLHKTPLNFASRTLLGFFSFYVGWWACALGPVYGYPWLGPVILVPLIAIHLYVSPVRKGEALFLLLLGMMGWAIDSLWIQLSLLTLEGEFAPGWLVGMWILLGMNFEGLLVMRKSRWLIALSGLVSGPLSYFFAQAMGILKYSEPTFWNMSMHAVFWMALMPRLFELRDWCLLDTIKRHSGDSGGNESGAASG
jgi:hypothetical protein